MSNLLLAVTMFCGGSTGVNRSTQECIIRVFDCATPMSTEGGAMVILNCLKKETTK